MKRIAMISEHASPLAVLGGTDSGGQNVYVAQLARHLARLGWGVDVFTRRDDPRLPQVVQWVDGVRIVHIKAGPPEVLPKERLLPLMDEFTREMSRFVRAERAGYALLHANFFMSGLVAANLKRSLGLPFVITFHALGRVRRQHQGEADAFPDARFAIEDRLVQEADLILAECPQDEADLRSLYGADPERIRVVPCGFDPAEFTPVNRRAARRELGLEEDVPLVLQLGRMVPRKGVDNVIRGFAHYLRNGGQPARLLVVGGNGPTPDPTVTPEIGRLQNVAREEGVQDRVTFTGSRDRDVLRYYFSAADVFVSTPWYEPFGITPLEAMACGTPVIGADVGGIRHTVVDGQTGYLVPPKDPQALARRLGDILGNPERAARLSQAAVARVREHFTWEGVARQVQQAYHEVLEEQRVRALGSEAATVDRAFERLIGALNRSRRELGPALLTASRLICQTFERGNKLLVCGNGGSAADAQHFAAELVGRFRIDGRRGLPVISLTADSALLTAWSNDVGFEDVFARQVEAFGQPGDLLIGISTSGRSPNVLEALRAARERGLATLALLGGSGGPARELADLAVVVPDSETPRIQEVQILALHLICELVEEEIMRSQPALEAGRPLPAPPQLPGRPFIALSSEGA
ncbi:phosphoheptose isomerase [Deinobacterium chartae]|uniref:Phosphoheptose isomerase n=1 Tax=Deinobacterium chartae TaxID=521158 RepID=A0A841HVI6_9DEIO|nr:glycosyltransferase [Deinobacterium chartae]MBB6097397.1 phosphoheptose isomerase [Deinobacterium chartae]